jgi:CDP-paratose 2-epimerase
MDVALITGSGGLIGSEAARFFKEKGFYICGIDNDMRKYFFGETASTIPNSRKIMDELTPESYEHNIVDIRHYEKLEQLFQVHGEDIKVVIHTAAQPSHDWAAKEPLTDFSINATGTMNMLELTRHYCPNAVFIFTSTNKVYGDAPNNLKLLEREMRYEYQLDSDNGKTLGVSHAGITEKFSIDQCKHSIFGASKVAADVMVQEYGKYFRMKTTTFRGGCLTGPAHSAAELHGFLGYLVKCAMTGKEYNIFGYKGKQVRDNIHSYDCLKAFWEVYKNPGYGEVYNIGGTRFSNCSIIEAFEMVKSLSGKKPVLRYVDDNRIGDHIWYISDMTKFKKDYPNWNHTMSLDKIVQQIIDKF